MAGRMRQCPTCGIGFCVPDEARLRQAGGEPVPVGQVPDEWVALHAYAAAGDMAPEVIEEIPGKAMIRCRRCGTISEIDANTCRSCGMPFTIEAGSVAPTLPVDGWAIASVLLGVTSLAAYYQPVVAAAAVGAGLVGLRRQYLREGCAQRVAAWSGVVLGGLSTASYVVRLISSSKW